MAKNFPHRVLVVDDELLIRWSIAEALEEHGHTVIEAPLGLGAHTVMAKPFDMQKLEAAVSRACDRP